MNLIKLLFRGSKTYKYILNQDGIQNGRPFESVILWNQVIECPKLISIHKQDGVQNGRHFYIFSNLPWHMTNILDTKVIKRSISIPNSRNITWKASIMSFRDSANLILLEKWIMVFPQTFPSLHLHHAKPQIVWSIWYRWEWWKQPYLLYNHFGYSCQTPYLWSIFQEGSSLLSHGNS